MGLPIVAHPTFSLILPSTKEKVEFRPFLVKEEKILLIAMSSEDQADIVRAIKQVISNCITTPSVTVEKFTTFDLEYFFIKLRAKSVQNIITLSYKDNEDQKIYDVEVNLDEVEIKQSEVVSDKIELTPTSGIVLRYPRLSIMDSVETINDPVEFNFAIMQACIDCIYDGDKVFKTTDFTTVEVQQFLDNLDVKTYQGIQAFIEAMPRVEHTIGYTNSNGKEVKIVLKTLTDFFTLG
jgi:hypothetical protein